MPPVFCAVTRTAAPRGAGLPPVRAASPSACGLATSPPGAFQSQHGQLATGPPLPRPLLGQRLGDPLHGETGASTALVTPHAAALEALEPSRAWHASSAVHSQRVVPPPPAAPDPEPTAVRCGAQRHVSRGGGKLQRGGPPGESLPYCHVPGVRTLPQTAGPLEPRTAVHVFALWAAFCMCIESSRCHRVLCQEDFLCCCPPEHYFHGHKWAASSKTSPTDLQAHLEV